MFFTIAFISTIGYLSPRLMLPEGLMGLASDSDLTMSSGESPYARIRSGFTLTMIPRELPPNGGGAETPGSVANAGRTRLSA